MKWFQRRIDFNALMQQHWRISSILPVGDLKQQAHRTARVPELSQLVNQALLICSSRASRFRILLPASDSRLCAPAE
jgi:hypothetical protein